MNTQETKDINGHRCVATGTDKGLPVGDQTVYECQDCKQRAPYQSFAVGARGCPARPESIDNISVCPGGDKCEGHPDQDSSEWRDYKSSDHLSIKTVPRWFHTDDDLAKRAADQYLHFADKIDMKMRVWSQQGYKVGPEGGVAATFQHANGLGYEVHVNEYGKITAVQEENNA